MYDGFGGTCQDQPMIDHFGINCADYAKSKEFYDAALKLGAEPLHEPRIWPEYHPGFFGAFVRDPDGNNVDDVANETAGDHPVIDC